MQIIKRLIMHWLVKWLLYRVYNQKVNSSSRVFLFLFTFIRFVEVKCQFSRATFSSSAIHHALTHLPLIIGLPCKTVKSSQGNYCSTLFKQRTSISCLGWCLFKCAIPYQGTHLYTRVKRGRHTNFLLWKIRRSGQYLNRGTLNLESWVFTTRPLSPQTVKNIWTLTNDLLLVNSLP